MAAAQCDCRAFEVEFESQVDFGYREVLDIDIIRS
jgi:hypothetical protein